MSFEKEVVIYTRVSTQDQGDNGIGLDSQLFLCSYYARQQNMSVIAVFTDIESGASTTGRTRLQEAVTACQKNGYYLMVSKADRLSRNVRDALEIYDKLDSRLICCDMPNTDRFVITVVFAVAERELENIRVRTKLCLEEKKRQIEQREGVPIAQVPMNHPLVPTEGGKKGWADAIYDAGAKSQYTKEQLYEMKLYDLNALYKRGLRKGELKKILPTKKNTNAINAGIISKEKSDEFCRLVFPLIAEYKNMGLSQKAIASMLNDVRKIPTSGGKKWDATTVRRVLERGEKLGIQHTKSL